jgi:poly [ADP-ribose] polymerase
VGVVVQENVTEARDLLHNTLAPYVEKGDYKNIKFIRGLEQYLMLIPKDIGRTFDPYTILGTQQKVQEQEQILDALEATIQSIVSGTNKPANATVSDEPKLFSVKLAVITDGREMDRIRKKYRDTRKSGHECAYLDVKIAYTVEIESMKKAFDQYGAKIGNIHELYHGSRTSNLLSILSKGLMIPPASASYCTGRLFGAGAYFASASSKSLNYSYGYWDGRKRDENCFMFMASVAAGKPYTPSRTNENLPKPGYDSTWAKAHVSGVVNDEIIVYKLHQCNLTHLIEFSPGGK